MKREFFHRVKKDLCCFGRANQGDVIEIYFMVSAGIVKNENKFLQGR